MFNRLKNSFSWLPTPAYDVSGFFRHYKNLQAKVTSKLEEAAGRVLESLLFRYPLSRKNRVLNF